MTKRMLIDASHPEETRVVVLDGSRLEEFDIEAASRKPLKGNIYLAKIVRVEPSLQAAFVEYGGNRHGFLAFGEIHPDYYQIPVADRERLLRLQAEEAAEEQAEEDRAARRMAQGGNGHDREKREPLQGVDATSFGSDGSADDATAPGADGSGDGGSGGFDGDTVEAGGYETGEDEAHGSGGFDEAADENGQPDEPFGETEDASGAPDGEGGGEGEGEGPPRPGRAMPARMDGDTLSVDPDTGEALAPRRDTADEDGPAPLANADIETVAAEPPAPETIGGEAEEGSREPRRIPQRWLKNYKIQEVIKRRQVVLIQVVKEERGTKGAALTTYISLAGRYSVLMPNTPKGGGISRKITQASDRKRLKEVIDELGMPEGMGVIVRTAGAQRPKPEIKRDCEYLLRLWDSIREVTLRSTAPALIYEEADLIKRSIRDGYSRDIDEVLVDGEDAYQQARDFMRMLMPSHAAKVRPYAESSMPLFAKHGVEGQLDAMHSPTVQLKSGGYIVINQTEALVAIDVNSGRSTKERHIEETALRTNLEASDEVARQLRLRDLAGLIVIDYIDMESSRHNAQVERRLKDALKNDRARIQLGRISHFGLMEMSRQRLRPSLAETSLVVCPHCNGQGHMRSTESAALTVLRAIEEEGGRGKAAEITVRVASSVALYLLNHKRARLGDIEARHGMNVVFVPDDSLVPPALKIDRTRAVVARDPDALPVVPKAPSLPPPEPIELEGEDVLDEVDEEEEEGADASAEARPGQADARRAEGDGGRKRKRRRRRGGRREDGRDGPADQAPAYQAPAYEAPVDQARAGMASGEPRARVADEARGTGPVRGGIDVTGFGPAPVAPPGEGAQPELGGPEAFDAGVAADAEGDDEQTGAEAFPNDPVAAAAADAERQRRRRGRRGGRRRRRENGDLPESAPVPEAPPPVPVPAPTQRWVGPTPANPFGSGFDLFDAFDTTPREEPSPRAEAVREIPIGRGEPAQPQRVMPKVIEGRKIRSAEPEAAPAVAAPAPAVPVEAMAAPEPVPAQPVEAAAASPPVDPPAAESVAASPEPVPGEPAVLEPAVVEPALIEPPLGALDPGDAVPADEAPKPKGRRPTTRKAKPEPVVEAQPEPEPEPEPELVPVKRKRATKAKATPEPESVPEPEPAPEPPAPKTRRRKAAEPEAEVPAPKAKAKAKPAKASASAAKAVEQAAPAAPKRGWWKRS